MSRSGPTLNPSEAAGRLGTSTKALHFYEERGLLRPVRTEAGWRAYGPREMEREAQVAALSFIIGPLGSGKTRLARRLAETIPGAAFLGLDRLHHHQRIGASRP